ncbi:50S ribosomal protein L29 [Candidatus Woesearchaeota archaeon]|nr:50S ribosomal protein L29 [Candidatus Woesearchaeota archaeon]
MKSVKELDSLKDDALDSRVVELGKELMKFRSQVAAGTIPKNPGRIRAVKRTIARIYTIKTRRKAKRE